MRLNIKNPYSSDRLWFSSINNNRYFYEYNSDGDMTSAGDLDCEYIPFHRMWQIEQDNNVLYSFGYDGNGQRVYRQSGSNTERYLLMSGFTMFSLKDPSLLAFDERKIEAPHNLTTIYGMGSIPCDTSMREILDVGIPTLSDR